MTMNVATHEERRKTAEEVLTRLEGTEGFEECVAIVLHALEQAAQEAVTRELRATGTNKIDISDPVVKDSLTTEIDTPQAAQPVWTTERPKEPKDFDWFLWRPDKTARPYALMFHDGYWMFGNNVWVIDRGRGEWAPISLPREAS